MRKSTYSILIILLGLLTFAGNTKATLISIPPNPGPSSASLTNVLFGTTQIGTAVTGTTNDANNYIVDFTSPVVVETIPGAARIDQNIGVFEQLSFEMQADLDFYAVEFNINVTDSAGDGIVNLFLDTTDTTGIPDFIVPVNANGQNKINIENDGIGPTEFFSSLTIKGVGNIQFDDIKQFKIGITERMQPIPEPATMLLFGVGLAGLAGTRLRRKK
ncbi:PEP-CTERM sorting domain-containing protein [Thermodesulfobacteriota bacterium]